jgi:hypothetical protein
MRAKDGIILSGLDEESKPSTTPSSFQQIRIENLKQELEKRKIDYQAVSDKKIIENNPEVEHNLELQLQNIAKKMEKIEQQLQELGYGDV